MNRFLTALACVCLALPIAAQTASTTISGNTITTVVQDAAGNIYRATTPFTISVQPGSTSLVFTPIVVTLPPPPPPPPTNGAPTIPSNAIAANLITATNWKPCVHDAGTPGTGTCSNNYPVTGITSDDARGFSMTYTGAGGVRWADDFAKDTIATNYVLDTQVISPDWTHTANLELDTNQTKADGHTAILGTQCSSYAHAWEITITNSSGSWSWTPTNVPCDPTKWAPNVLHHIRIFGSISAAEVSTYTGVEFDGTYTAFTNGSNMTGRALGWAVGSNLTNFQIDGLGASGSATIYADRLTEYRW
jgi:hypothetical protein